MPRLEGLRAAPILPNSRLLSGLTPSVQCLPFLLGDNQDIIEQEQVACGSAANFPKDTGFLQEKELPTFQQPAGGGDEREGLGMKEMGHSEVG